MLRAFWTPLKVPSAAHRRVTRANITLLRDRITVGVILVFAALLLVVLFFLAGLAGTDYWPMLP
jgi:hypothetical protein